MKRTAISFFLFLLCCAALVVAQSRRSYGPDRVWWDAGRGLPFPLEEEYDDPDGLLSVLNSSGAVNPSGNAFFEALGTNHRACITCHQPSNAMSLAAATLRQRWLETQGKDPVFAAIDGSNCPDLPQTEMSSHSLLLNRGLIRIFLPWPPKTAPISNSKSCAIQRVATQALSTAYSVRIPQFPFTAGRAWSPILNTRRI